MKFTSIVLAFLLLFQITPLSVLLAEDQEKVIVISDIVGKAIDKEESKKYKLFMNIADFECAIFYTKREPGFLIEIETKDDTIFSNIGDAMMESLLKDYFERYEDYETDRGSFEEKWSIIAYDAQGIPITQNEALKYISKASWWTYGCCVYGGLGGVAAGYSIILSRRWQKEEDLHLIFLGTSIAIGSILGYAIGNKIDKSRISRDDIIKKIRELRTPR